MNVVVSPEVTSAENAYMGRMRELDSFVQDFTKGEEYPIQIIDHDFAPAHTPLPSTPGSLAGFDRAAEQLQGDIGDDEINANAMRSHLASTRLVIAHMAGGLKIGKDIEFTDYIEATLGVKPEITSEEELAQQREAIDELLSKMGYRYDASDADRFTRNHALGKDDIEGAVMRLIPVVEADLNEASGKISDDLQRPRMLVEEVEDLYQGYFGINEKGEDFMRVNTNPLLYMSELDIRSLLDHEGQHWRSTATKRMAVSNGEARPDIGIVPVFSSRYTLEEIIARSAEGYVLEQITDRGGDYEKFVSLSMKYINAVRVNMIIMANTGYSQEEVIKYGVEHMPFEPEQNSTKNADMYTKSLLYKSVFAVDEHVVKKGREIAALPTKQRQQTLAQLILQPALPEELKTS